MRYFALSTLVATALTLIAQCSANAVNVSPRGVNVRTFGPTTVFLTFFGLDEDQRPAEALWCGAINANQSCVPGTVLLPQIEWFRLLLRDRTRPGCKPIFATMARAD